MPDDRRDVDCFVDEDKVRCEVDGREIELADQEQIREQAEEVVGEASSPQVCAALTEEWTEKHVHEEFKSPRDRFTLGRTVFIRGCPLPRLTFESDEERLENANDARERLGRETKDEVERDTE